MGDLYRLTRNYRTLKRWGHNRVTLLGDAAHAVTPWVGQGAGISVEDAFDLTHRLLEYPDDIPKAINIYEKTRIPRANLIRSAANQNMKIFRVMDDPFWQRILKV